MRISELFFSIQGEGKLMGVPSAFVRASGCNLRCVWCDTPYASWNPDGADMPVAEIVRQSVAFGARHVVITGGEPMIMPDIVPLCAAFREAGMHITIETAATVYSDLEVDLASLSPKLANSTPTDREGGKFAIVHERQRMNIPVIQKFIDAAPDFQLKFVVSMPTDLEEIQSVLKQLRHWRASDVLLMPEGIDPQSTAEKSNWLSDLCKQTGYRFCPRLHLMLYGNKRGT